MKVLVASTAAEGISFLWVSIFFVAYWLKCRPCGWIYHCPVDKHAYHCAFHRHANYKVQKKSGVIERDLVLVYSSLIRSVLEYASPVWANLPEYLSLLIEGVQKKALEIIFPGLPYKDALVRCGLRTLSDRRASACTKFIQRVRDTGVLANLLPQRTTVSHGYNLRSGTFREDPAMASTNRLDKFITYRYS